MKFNEKIRALREDRDIKQEDMGKILSLSQIAVSQYERGVREPSYETLKKYADFFGVSTDYLLGRTNNQQSENNNMYLVAARSKDNKAPIEYRPVKDLSQFPETDEDL